MAEYLVPDEFPTAEIEDSDPVEILVIERHFLPARDDRIINFARGLVLCHVQNLGLP